MTTPREPTMDLTDADRAALIAQLEDLIVQATRERSHYYVASVARKAVDALRADAALREEIAQLKEWRRLDKDTAVECLTEERMKREAAEAQLRAVPREPTDDMMLAAFKVAGKYSFDSELAKMFWRAMYDAAPGPSASPVHPVGTLTAQMWHGLKFNENAEQDNTQAAYEIASPPEPDVAAIICPVHGHTCWGPHKAGTEQCHD